LVPAWARRDALPVEAQTAATIAIAIAAPIEPARGFLNIGVLLSLFGEHAKSSIRRR
jgi:hypothetical protein